MIKKLIVGNMQTNCYLVYNHEKHCLVIDPGANGKKYHIISKKMNYK